MRHASNLPLTDSTFFGHNDIETLHQHKVCATTYTAKKQYVPHVYHQHRPTNPAHAVVYWLCFGCCYHRQDVHTLVSRLPPAVEDVGPAYAWGAVGRLQRRYDSQAAFDPTVFDLSYALSGRREVGPLVAALPRWPQLQHLRLRNNGWDDWAVQVGAGT